VNRNAANDDFCGERRPEPHPTGARPGPRRPDGLRIRIHRGSV